MLKTTSVAILLASTAGAAFAAGPDPITPAPIVTAPTPAPVAAPSWEGGYIGGQIGYGYGEFDLDVDDFDESSVIGGLNAGYLWSVGNGWYVGPEFQYDWADISVEDADSGNTASFDEMARLKLKLGRELGNGLLYGSAGLAYGSVDGVDEFIDGSEGSYVVGLGYDYRVNQDWTLGLEYQYHDFNNIGEDGGDLAVNTVHVKAGYNF